MGEGGNGQQVLVVEGEGTAGCVGGIGRQRQFDRPRFEGGLHRASRSARPGSRTAGVTEPGVATSFAVPDGIWWQRRFP